MSDTSSHTMLTLALVPAARLVWASVNARRHGAWQVDIGEAGIDRSILGPLAGQLRCLLAAVVPGTAPLAVGVHLERGMRHGSVEMEVSPYLASVYLARGAMPQRTADDLAAALTYIAHHI